jgi:PAS domain S-box-containing protein
MSSAIAAEEDLSVKVRQLEADLARERLHAAELTSNANGLIELQSKMQALLHQSSEGMIIFNGDSSVQSFNRTCEKMFDYSEIELLYRTVGHLFPGSEKFEGGLIPYLRYLSMMQGDEVHYGRRSDGSYIPLRISLNEVVSADLTLFSDEEVVEVKQESDASWTLCVLHDMTRELQVQNGLREQAKTLESLNRTLESLNKAMAEANAQKTSFLSNVGHELRTPLNGILGVSQVLEQQTLSPEISVLVTAMRDSGERLRRIVDDILHMTKGGQSEVKIVPLDLRDFLANLSQSYTHTATAKGLSFTLEIAQDLPAQVRTDATRLGTALDKLLDNAVKFTETGSIRCTAAKRMDVYSGQECVVLAVVDTGVGIATDHMEHLFTAFYQVDGSHTRKVGGTGLGLAVAKQCVEALGASLEIDSVPDRGSTFAIVIPCQGSVESELSVQEVLRQSLGALRERAGEYFGDVARQVLQDLRSGVTDLLDQKTATQAKARLLHLESTVELLGAKDLLRACGYFLSAVETQDEEAMTNARKTVLGVLEAVAGIVTSSMS